MESKKIKNKHILRIDRGEEIVETLTKYCKENNINLGIVVGIGAVNNAVIGLFKCATKEYIKTEITGDHEITSLLGNISTKDGETYLHLHINLSDEKYQTRGGHLNSAIVSGTGEIFIIEVEGNVDRKFSDEIGLNLFHF